MKTTIVAAMSLLAAAFAAFPDGAAAQTCCQYAGSCEDLPPGTAAAIQDCVAAAGQPVSGACLAAEGLCEGTVVCCDTTCCEVEASCSMTTASDCKSLHEGAIPIAGATCSADGSCVTECSTGCSEAGQVYCAGDCVALATDHQNCGECGNACGDKEVCTDGVCTPAGTIGQATGPVSSFAELGDDFLCFGLGFHTKPAICQGKCTDLADDSDNCGACWNQCSGFMKGCVDGQCVTLRSNGESCARGPQECASGCCIEGRCGSREATTKPEVAGKFECVGKPSMAACKKSSECSTNCCSGLGLAAYQLNMFGTYCTTRHSTWSTGTGFYPMPDISDLDSPCRD